jgi:hypothetical protein
MIAEIITRLKFWWAPSPASHFADFSPMLVLLHADAYNPFTDEVTVMFIAVHETGEHASGRYIVMRKEWLDRDLMLVDLETPGFP